MLGDFFDLNGLTPHGFCLSWRPELFWSMAVSDGVIAASYISISVAIAVYIVKRRDIYLRWVAMAFALFILLCAASHLSDLWTLWSPDYGIQAMVKAITALVSLLTAIALGRSSLMRSPCQAPPNWRPPTLRWVWRLRSAERQRRR